MNCGLWLATASLATAATAMDGPVLEPKTADGFAKYAAAVEARIGRELLPDGPYLTIDREPPERAATTLSMLKQGEVVVSRATAVDDKAKEIEVDGGLINHWRGTVLVPKVRLDELLANLMEPGSDRHKQEDVLRSTVLSRDGDHQKVYLRLKRTKVITVVYDTEYDVNYRHIAPGRASSASLSTRIVEVEDAGTPKERTLPEGRDHGFMWRMNSYWRYKQVDGGVIVEVESLTLSRPLPPIFGAFMRPIITHIARETLDRTLTSIRARFAS